ncbi:hypothetical protein FACS1894133_3070 [Clostridia bacterium]|nr:hypothetical protein FACS1894133_3070 [Clostridia bacterium]
MSLYSDGKIEGKLEGKIEGKIEKALQVAKKMLRKGVDSLTVSEYTDLDYDTIQRLADSR